jgi:hypothetical protein
MDSDLIKNTIMELAHEPKPLDKQIEKATIVTVYDVCSRIDMPELEKEGTITIASGLGTLPSDFERMRWVWYGTTKLDPLKDMGEFNKLWFGGGLAGNPYKYTLFGNKVKVYPKLASGTLDVGYMMNYSTVENINERYLPLIVKGILKELFTYGSKEWQALNDDYNKHFSRYLPRIRERKSVFDLNDERKLRNAEINAL